MDNKFIIAGNWKMNKTVKESLEFISELNKRLKFKNAVEVLLFPPFTSLYPVSDIKGKITIGAQNFYYEDSGAYTGEISCSMLKNIVKYLLIGHSERRQIFKENNELINEKVKVAFKNDFTPLLCVGETLDERENGNTFKVIENQLTDNLKDISNSNIDKIVIAYEPIWAIGTGKTATPEQAQEVHNFIRNFLSKISDNANTIPILYGGSVKPENSLELLSQNDINGALIGGASLKVEQFFDIITNSYKLV
jgi:triosephosphate isomerase